MGNVIIVEFEVELPSKATDDQVTEWLKYELSRGSINASNPLAKHDIEADYSSLVWRGCL